MTPKCTHWLGHKFEGRYSSEPMAPLKFGDLDVTSMTEDTFLELAKLDRRGRTYERDVCVRCGATVEQIQPTAAPQ